MLYSLVCCLTGTKMDNPLPEHTDDEELGDEFADFFMGKIKTILDSLADHARYNPHSPARASLNQFTSVSPEDVICIIQGMPTKSCEGDVIPTSLLKEILLALAPLRAKIF